MNKIGRNKRLWLERQGCIFKDEKSDLNKNTYTIIYTKRGEYVGLADLGAKENTINFIYKHRLTNLMSESFAQSGKLNKKSCNAVSIAFNEKEQAWYGWNYRGFGKFYVGQEFKKNTIPYFIKQVKTNSNNFNPIIESLDEAKQMAIDLVEYLS